MKKSLFFIAALGALVCSCNTKLESEESPVQVIDQTEHTVFYASFEGQDTKAGFGKEGSVYVHHWNVGDYIYIYPKDVANPYPQQYRCTNVNGTFEFVKEYKECSPANGTPTKNYAVYTSNPQALIFNVSQNRIMFSISENPDSVGPDSNGAYGYDNNMIAISDDNHLEFKNCMGWLKLQLRGNQKVSQILITQPVGSAVRIAGGDGLYVTYDGASTPSLNTESLSDESYKILNIAEPYAQLSMDQATEFYIPLPPVTLNSLKATVYFSDGTSTYIEKRTAGSYITIERNKVTPMSAKMVSTSIEDLSSSATANCYIVNDAAKTYKFKATVKGNSNESVGTPARAEILWTTKMTSTALSSKTDVIENVRYFDGYVYFTTKDTYVKGNTVIAVKDASDNILWSWHIWSPGHAVTTDVDDFTSTKFMKYDLGQVDGVSDYLVYQWGRKDPFVRWGSNQEASLRTAFLPASIFTYTNDSASIDASVANPSKDYENWKALKDVELWKENVKTKYDPCPAGWRVQSKTKLASVMTTTDGFKSTDTAYRISDSSTPYIAYLGHMSIINSNFNISAGDRYWTSYSEARSSDTLLPLCHWLERASTATCFKLTNTGDASDFAAVRCIAE